MSVLGGSPLGKLLRLEPEGNLSCGCSLAGIRSVDDVSADFDSEITTDGTRGRDEGVGGSNEATCGSHNSLSLPDHGNEGTRSQEGDESVEETLALVLSIVLLCDLLGGMDGLESNELESLSLETADDLTNETTLNTVGLDSNESSLSRHFKKEI